MDEFVVAPADASPESVGDAARAAEILADGGSVFDLLAAGFSPVFDDEEEPPDLVA